MPRLTEATKQARRRQIIDAAFTCFTAKGYTHTSMSDIIKESGLSSGSIYSHFDGKGDILHATVQQRIDMITAAYQELNTPSPRDIMRMIYAPQPSKQTSPQCCASAWKLLPFPRCKSLPTHFLPPCTILLPSRSPLGVSSISRRKINAKPSADELHSFVSDTADALILTFQGFMVRSTLSPSTDREHLFQIALSLLPE